MIDLVNLEELSRAECLRAMATEPVGRLAITMPDGFPLVVPVNFVLDGETVVFRTGAGTKLGNIGQKVGFQVDHFRPQIKCGWSVLVRGTVYEATHWEIDHLVLEPWTDGRKSHWLRILPVEITGRQIVLPDFR